MDDVVVSGAGPAGCVAAIVLARAGARVRLLDRARFPRHKLCGDTLNPGALAVLARLRLAAADVGVPITGMLVTGPGGVRVDAVYPGGATGRAITRSALDEALLAAAVAAGVQVEEGVLVRHASVASASQAVAGVCIGGANSGELRLPARLVIAADGRESRLARGAGLSRHAERPRRWAIGAYFTGVHDVGRRGEMHVRSGHYVGVAPLPGGLINVCVVTGDRARLRGRGDRIIAAALQADPGLADRFASASMVTPAVVLGPLAVECRRPGVPGLLLAGDAAGFIDPMTGDGLRFALRGGELAALAALAALDGSDRYPEVTLARARQREFAGKCRFNRLLRRLAGSANAVRIAGYATRVTSWPVDRIVQYAGDVTPASQVTGVSEASRASRAASAAKASRASQA